MTRNSKTIDLEVDWTNLPNFIPIIYPLVESYCTAFKRGMGLMAMVFLHFKILGLTMGYKEKEFANFKTLQKKR